MEENLINWIKHLSQKRDELDGFSICPFAKKAMDEKNVFYDYINQKHTYFIEEHIIKKLQEIESTNDIEVMVFYNTHKDLTDEQLTCIITNLNNKREYSGYIFLKDHPDRPGIINGVCTGNGQYPIVLAQPRKKLMAAREILKNSRYYDNWSEDYKQEIWSYGNDS